jgi:hypothetical protein
MHMILVDPLMRLPLGHAEVNFLKNNISELADIWIPLKGQLSQACQSKLHLKGY